MLAPKKEKDMIERKRHVDPITPKTSIGMTQVTRKVERVKFLVFLA